MEFHQTWYRGAPLGVDELIRFWARFCPTSRVKGQWTWSKYAIFPRLRDNSSITWWNFIKLGTGGAPPGVDELIRFWAISAQRQGSKVNELGLKYVIFPPLTRNLKKPLVDFHQTWYRGAPLGVDELIRFWARSTQCQRSRVNELGLICYFYLVNAKSQEGQGSMNLV